MILSVAYKFVDLYNSLPEEKQNYRDSILTILMDFILSNSELNYEVFDYLENTSTDIKTVTKIIKKMLLQTNLPLDLPAVHKRILEDSDNNFDDAQKRLSFYTLFENYNSMSKEKQTYIFEFFISAVCGEFNVPPHLREEMAEKCCKERDFNHNDRFVKEIVSKCETNQSLFNTLPDVIRESILESKNIPDDKKTRNLLQIVRQAREEGCSSSDKEKAKSSIIKFILSASSDAEKTRLLDNILSDYLL